MSTEKILDFALSESDPKSVLETAKRARARLVAEEDLILSGKEVFDRALKRADDSMEMKWQFENGEPVLKDQCLGILGGPIDKINAAKKVGLGFLRHMSGIASLTRFYVKAVEDFDCEIRADSSHTPGLSEIEYRAVLHGGGVGPKEALKEGICLEQSTVESLGGARNAIDAAFNKNYRFVQLEVHNLDQLRQAIEAQAHSVKLKAFSIEQTAEALKLLPRTIEAVLHGRYEVDQVPAIAATGVKAISLKGLVTSAPAARIRLDLEA